MPWRHYFRYNIMHLLKPSIFFIGFLLFTFVGLAQQTPTPLDLEIQKAQRAFDIKKYNTAANLYKKIYPKVREEDKQNDIIYMIAESYRRANNFKQAFDWYEKLVNTKYP